MNSEEKAAAVDSVAPSSFKWIALTCPDATGNCQTNFDLWVWEYSNKRLTETVGWGTRFTKSGANIKGGGLNENCVHWWHLGAWGPQPCTASCNTLCEHGKKHCKY